jgi:predicted deacylase
MRNYLSPKYVIALSVLVALGSMLFLLSRDRDPKLVPAIAEKVETYPVKSVLGTSVEGREIESYRFGNGSTTLAIVGGIHGGYEWNSSLLAYELMDYLSANQNLVSKYLTVIIIPNANPDGLYKIVKKEGRFKAGDVPTGVNEAPGRFNANGIDLNRNFDCKWQPKSTWQNKTVSAGTKPFSEPEAAVIRDFALSTKPASIVFLHSQSSAVYASQCEDGILPETLNIMNTYAKASGYKAVPEFDAYETTGDSEAWLAKVGIPSITVELTNHTDTDLEKNLAGIKALLKYYSSRTVISESI